MVSGRLSSQCSNEVNEKILFFLIGAPKVPPSVFNSVPRRARRSWPGVMASVGSADRVHARIAEERIGRPVQAVRARLHVQADDAPEAVAVLGIGAGLGDGDFLDRVHGGGVGRLVAGAERHAVEQHVVGAPGAAARVVVVRERVVVRAVLVRRAAHARVHRRIEHGEVVGVAAADRHLVQELPLERELGVAAVQLDLGALGDDGHRFLDAAHVECEVAGHVTALLDADGAVLGLLEAGQLRDDRVGARLDEIEDVVPRGVGHARDRHAGGVVPQRHGDAGKDGLAGVDDGSLDPRAVILRDGRGGHRRHDDGETE